MTQAQLFDIEKILNLGTPEFIIENTEIKGLAGGIKKKFTSLSKSPVTYTQIYDPTLFRWDFGDGTPIVETDKRVIFHTYAMPGTYLVRHQACNFCTCSEWNLCFQSIDVVPPQPDIAPLLIGGGLIWFIAIKRECERYDNDKDCKEDSNCQWLKEEKKCVRRCKEDYTIEKQRTDGIKRPHKYTCVPIKKESKPKKETGKRISLRS